MTNNATVSADSSGNTLILDGSVKTGNGAYMAANGGTLLIGTTITGGTLNTSNGGVITGNGNGVLNNLTNAGTLTFNSSELFLEGTINNTGVIESDSSGGNAYLYGISGQTTTLSGGGSVLLTKSNAIIESNGGWGFLNQDNLIHGFGEISAPLTNNATVSADSSGNTLLLDGAAKTNNGTLQAINGGILAINANVTGGTVQGLGTGVVSIQGSRTQPTAVAGNISVTGGDFSRRYSMPITSFHPIARVRAGHLICGCFPPRPMATTHCK